jgi:hypothetical protein
LQFSGQEVVVTAKMDGENTTMYSDYLHARSLDYQPHPSRTWVRGAHARVAHDIPAEWRVCGENLYAKHSIYYEHLTSYFQVFSVWDHTNTCLDWDSTVEWATLLGFEPVPVLYRGSWDEAKVRMSFAPRFRDDECEGYVVRLAAGFPYRRFRHCVAKYVRANHVTTDDHWRHAAVVPNGVDRA